MPWDMKYVVNKLESAGCKNVLLCERGTFFGYGRLVNDMRSLSETACAFGVPVVFDATHSVQEPGGLGVLRAGNRAMVEPLARAAVAVGVDGLFFETHPTPETSPSDGPNMALLDEFEGLLERTCEPARNGGHMGLRQPKNSIAAAFKPEQLCEVAVTVLVAVQFAALLGCGGLYDIGAVKALPRTLSAWRRPTRRHDGHAL